jgi:glycosyltransferase involved in cell wall biosynthesis
LGAAIKHADYRTVVVNDDFIIKPVDGFGNPEMIRVLLATEKPDAVLIFTDPRFFIWLWEMEDEIHQMCPIVYWHVWDNGPRPEFNDVLYESTDLINCHSYPTYQAVSKEWPDRTNFVPHSLPEDIFFPITDQARNAFRSQLLGPGKENHMVAFWMNRNAKRKRPNDLLWAWKIFLEQLEEKHGHRNATLLMHTNPKDSEGPNLIAVAEMFGIQNNVTFSNERIDFDKINILHNISDVCVNISFAEGFGLATLEAMQAGKPIIAIKTGGLTRQVVDHRDGKTEHGVALPVEFKSLVGSQNVPYIYEDYVSAETVASAFMKMYELGPKGRKELGQRCRDYALSEFGYQKTIDLWHETMLDCIENWQDRYERWTCKTF